MQIMVANYMIANDLALLAKLRCDISSHLPLSAGRDIVIRFDTLVISPFLEYLYPIQFAIFTLRDSFFFPIYNPFAFKSIREREGKPKMNPIALVVIIAMSEHLDKTVLKLGFSAWIKGRDKLLV